MRCAECDCENGDSECTWIKAGTEVKTIQIDDKWSVQYDTTNNDRPIVLLRYNEEYIDNPSQWSNATVAMFYALLEQQQTIQALQAENERLEFYNDQLKGFRRWVKENTSVIECRTCSHPMIEGYICNNCGDDQEDGDGGIYDG